MTRTYGNTVVRKKRSPVIVDQWNPEAAACCDGCGFWIPHRDLRQRMEYRGGVTPVGTGIYVCQVCDDVPNAQLAKPVFYADPYPVKNPRPDPAVTTPIYVDVPPQVQEITAFRITVPVGISDQDVNGWTRCTPENNIRVPIGWPNLPIDTVVENN